MPYKFNKHLGDALADIDVRAEIKLADFHWPFWVGLFGLILNLFIFAGRDDNNGPIMFACFAVPMLICGYGLVYAMSIAKLRFEKAQADLQSADKQEP